jgi:pathogenesis-related protein 1
MKLTKKTAEAILRLTGLLSAVGLAAACVPTPGAVSSGVTGAPPAPAPPAAGTGSVDAAAMLAAHNQWRAQTGVPALVWSDKLTGIAQSWVSRLAASSCSFEHSGSREYGENLYVGSAVISHQGNVQKKIKPEEVVESWASEGSYYNYADNSCASVCGHYTQLVWRDTKEVGCAMAVCADKTQIWMCSYYPAGNMLGKKPY